MILTKRQKELYDYIDDYIATNGYAPTLEEIGERFQLSSLATVHKHLSNLEQKGVIRRKWNFSRAIELVPMQRKTGALDLPLLGYVAAGQPIEAVERDDTFCVPEEFIRRQNTFVLRVKGDSMIEDGICDGDYIVVEERQTANNGETVVALINGDATVKRFQRDKGGKVRLVPANQSMQPIIVKDKDLAIRGVVVAVMRKY
ncbi:MAG: transcriptional repressor LexA [Deltaproteobacteria bacterium]|nr:transcriptional repressor LexA [Deltaproteobacteria bacterium]